MAPFKVIIVGGGLAGSLLANGLLNNGVEVAVYERDAADSKKEGYQIRLGEAADAGFKACLTDEVRAAILAKFGQSSGAGNTAPTVCNSRFEPILDLTLLSGYAKSSAINRVVLRNILLEPVKAAGHVHFQKRLDRYKIVSDERGSECVQVQFSDGSVDICDVLVGADGSRSRVNCQVGVRNLVDVDSHMMFLNKGHLTEAIISTLPSRLRAGPVLTFTKDMTFFFALYLPADSEGGCDLSQGSFYWGLTVRRARIPDADPLKLSDFLGFCLEQTQDWAPEYRTMFAAGFETGQTDNILVVPLRASNKPSKKWRQHVRKRQAADINEGHPRVWLIGDAIHAMQPNRGMGGNQAMQDCADALPELLKLSEMARSGMPVSSQDLTSAVTRYEDKMIDRAFAWVRKSGGTSVPAIDLDGSLGTFLKVLGSVIWLFAFCFCKLFSSVKVKQS